MRTVIKYVADDGVEFTSKGKALLRDAQLKEMKRIMSILKPIPDTVSFMNGEGYVQQELDSVSIVKNRLLDMASEISDIPKDVVARAREIDPLKSIIGRYFDDMNSILNGAWYRLCCIDENGREWGQPYYVIHPSNGRRVEINNTGE